MNMQATFHNEDGSKTTYHGIQAWSMMQAKSKPYVGVPKLKQLPATKANYKGKTAAGGRKAVFSQSRGYKKSCLDRIARPWGKEGPYRDPLDWERFSVWTNRC